MLDISLMPLLFQGSNILTVLFLAHLNATTHAPTQCITYLVLGIAFDFWRSPSYIQYLHCLMLGILWVDVFTVLLLVSYVQNNLVTLLP